ncbi:MAG: cytochrome c biogenesis CcdA family protein [Acidimicrobiales bacterium]
MSQVALLFVAGFTLVFTVLGVAAGLLGALVLRELPLVMDIAGAGLIAMGLAMAGVLRVPWLQRERRFALQRVPTGPGAAFGVGMAFAAGWTPCIGPVLATILTIAAATGTAAWGALLLVLFSLGLGLPFVALALGPYRARGSLAWLRRHGRAIEVVGGLLLVGVGVLFVSGAWRSFFVPLQRVFARFGWPPV